MTLARSISTLLVVMSLTACAAPPLPTLTSAPPTATIPVVPPSATSTPPTAATLTSTETPTPPPSATFAPTPTTTAAPAYTQAFTVTFTGDLFGEVVALTDGLTETWASLRGNGYGMWTFDLGRPYFVSNLRLWAVSDEGDPSLVQRVDLSGDGERWDTVTLNLPDCRADVCLLLENEWTSIAILPAPARYVRVLAGPRWLALAEVQIEVRPVP